MPTSEQWLDINLRLENLVRFGVQELGWRLDEDGMIVDPEVERRLTDNFQGNLNSEVGTVDTVVSARNTEPWLYGCRSAFGTLARVLIGSGHAQLFHENG